MTRTFLILCLRIYRWTISPLLALVGGPGSGCRYFPTCSEYAIEAIGTHGTLRGSLLALRRFMRCAPWGGFGYDPVPPLEIHRFTRGGRPQRAALSEQPTPLPPAQSTL